MSKDANTPATKADIALMMERLDQLSENVGQLSSDFRQLSENTVSWKNEIHESCERWKDEMVEEMKRHFDIAVESLVRDFNGAFHDDLALMKERQGRCERRILRLERTVRLMS